MTKICDNVSNVHDNVMVKHESDGVRYRCKICNQINVLRIGADGRMENRNYTKVFKRDLLQPHDNLYFKIYPDKMSLV